jgi:hypothetical protein
MFEIHVAPHGTPGCDPEGHNDRDGLSPSFGEGRAGPAPNIEAALRMVRYYRQNGRFEGRATITLLPGDHHLPATLELTQRDNGGITLQGGPGGTATVWGGRPLQGWQAAVEAGRTIWEADVAAHLLSHGPFCTLWVDGRLAPRPRWPKLTFGYLRMDGVPGRTTKVELHRGSDRFLFTPGDVPESVLKNPDGVDVCVPHFWVEERLPIASIDREAGEIVSSHCSRFCLTDSHSGQWARYYLDNVGSALSEPGEWFLDRRRKVLRYLPRQGETPETTRVVIPVLRQFLRIRGDDAARCVSGIEIRNLRFCATEWDFPEDENQRVHVTDAGVVRSHRQALPHETVVKPLDKPWASAVQAAFNTPGSIGFSHARQCTVRGCRFEGIGGYALRVDEDCRQIILRENDLGHLGAGGIAVDGGGILEPADSRTEQVFIDRNHIHHGGWIFPSACGVIVTHAARVRIADNHIHHLSYSGISVGWTWGFADTVNSEIRIERNRVHHLGQRGAMSDLAGIYLLGKSPACLVRENIVHDVACASYGGIGLYADQGASFITFERNLVFRVQEACVMEHWSRANIYRDNLFACSGDGNGGLMLLCGEKNQRFWDYPPQTLRLEGNCFVASGTPVFRSILNFRGQAEFIKRGNRYWDIRRGGHLVYMANGHWELPSWSESFAESPDATAELGALLANPDLVDPASGDFRRRGVSEGSMPFVRIEAGAEDCAIGSDRETSTLSEASALPPG